MTSGLQEKLCHANSRLAELTEMTHKALRGEHRFGVEEVQELRKLLTEMEPVLAESANLRGTHPEIAGQLNQYKSQLLELQKTVEKIRVTLIVQKTALEASRTQVNAISQWCSAFRQTS